MGTIKMKNETRIYTYQEILKLPNSEIKTGRRGWTKAKCLDEGCNTITLWNTLATGIKCSEGSCGKCEGQVKRTVWSADFDYVIKETK